MPEGIFMGPVKLLHHLKNCRDIPSVKGRFNFFLELLQRIFTDKFTHSTEQMMFAQMYYGIGNINLLIGEVGLEFCMSHNQFLLSCMKISPGFGVCVKVEQIHLFWEISE